MRAISVKRAKEMLGPLGLSIGAWNELTDIQHASENFMYQPPRLANELYVFCHDLAQWLSSEDWTLIQIDNSTSPLEDEIKIMESIFAMSISEKTDANISFIVDGNDIHSKLTMLVFLIIIFEWHVYLVSSSSKNGKRLGLQDGVAYFFGSSRQLKDARSITEKFKSNPLALNKTAPSLFPDDP